MSNSPKKSVKQRASIFDTEVKPRHGSRNSMLSSLRATQLVIAKPVLPVELISVILDHVSPSTLIRFAQVSRKLKELVYDDSRWIDLLRSIGVWDENESIAHQEDATRQRQPSQQPRADPLPATNGTTAALASRSTTEIAPDTHRTSHRKKPSLIDGFDDLNISSSNSHSLQPSAQYIRAVHVLRDSKSIRGRARQTYGRIHAALSPFYQDITKSFSSSDPLIFRAFTDPLQQAHVLSNLEKFSRVDRETGRTHRLEKLQETIDTFQNRTLNDFRNAYDNKLATQMHSCVQVADVLNTSQAMVDIFIDSHPLIIGTQRLANPLDCVEGVAVGHVDLGPSRRFFERLAVIFSEQSALIDQVFLPNLNVLDQFLRKVNSKVIQDFVKATLTATHDAGKESFLKTVPGVVEQSMRFSVSFDPSKGSSPSFQQDCLAILLGDLKEHIENYLAEELDWFKSKAEANVKVWEHNLSEQESRNESFFMSNVNRQAAKRDFLSSFKKVVMMPVNAVAAFPLPGAGSRSTSLQVPEQSEQGSRPTTPAAMSGPSTPFPEAPTDELAAKAALMNSRLEGIKTLFSIEVALDLVHLAKSSIERVAILARPGSPYHTEASQECETIFVNLIQILGQQHIKLGFDKAVTHLSSYSRRDMKGGRDTNDDSSGAVEPLVTFLELVNVGDLIQQMVDVFYAQELVSAKLTDRDDFLNPAVKAKKAFEQMLDERVAAGMSKGIDVLMDEVDHLCATTQAATDYNPPPGTMPDIGPTATATAVTGLVQRHTAMLTGSTDKAMLDVFQQEVGLRLFGSVSKHLKRQRVSVDGAIRLIADVNAYSAFILDLRQKPLVPYAGALRELAGIYLVDVTGPARAKELAAIIADTERYKGVLGVEEVLEFAERRADWYTVRADVERAMYGIGCSVM